MICCKKFYRKQTKWTNHIVENMLQENLQKVDKMNKPYSKEYDARSFTENRQKRQILLVKGPDGARGLLDSSWNIYYPSTIHNI